jgi:hypothetical protein
LRQQAPKTASFWLNTFSSLEFAGVGFSLVPFLIKNSFSFRGAF